MTGQIPTFRMMLILAACGLVSVSRDTHDARIAAPRTLIPLHVAATWWSPTALRYGIRSLHGRVVNTTDSVWSNVQVSIRFMDAHGESNARPSNRIQRPDLTVHGIRHSFATVALDRASLDGDVVLELLNGAPGFATLPDPPLLCPRRPPRPSPRAHDEATPDRRRARPCLAPPDREPHRARSVGVSASRFRSYHWNRLLRRDSANGVPSCSYRCLRPQITLVTSDVTIRLSVTWLELPARLGERRRARRRSRRRSRGSRGCSCLFSFFGEHAEARCRTGARRVSFLPLLTPRACGPARAASRTHPDRGGRGSRAVPAHRRSRARHRSRTSSR